MCTAILSYTLEQRRNTILNHDTCSRVSCNPKCVTLHISRSDVCQRMNKIISSTMPELHPILVKSPWYHIGIDFVGPITPPSHNGNRYILTLSDYITKWVEAVALPSKCAQGVAKSLFKVCLIGICKLAIICSNLLLCTLLVQVWLYFCSYTLLVSADLHAYGIATSVDNRWRDRIPQPTQWRAHEESRDQTLSDHCVPPTGNICTTGFMHRLLQ